MKRLLIALLLASTCKAQGGNTTITATVLDPNGALYSNSQVNITFIEPNTPGKIPLLNGSVFQKQLPVFGTDSFAHFSASVADTGVIDSSSGTVNSQWSFRITFSDRQTSFVYVTPINCSANIPVVCIGNSMDISAQLQAVAAIIPALGGSASPGNPETSVQFRLNNKFTGNPNLTYDSVNDIFKSGNNAPKGPNPYIDVTRYGVRSLSIQNTPAGAGITATTTSGTNVVTVSTSICAGQNNSVCFVNGDGVLIYGAGAASGITTPVGVAVTPVVASAGTGTGNVVNGPTGGTTYNYQVIARDKQGAVTAASSVASTAIGATTLGLNSVAITSISRAGNVSTVTTSSAHGLVVGAEAYITGTTDDTNFGGWQIVNGSADNTHFTYISGMDTNFGSPSSATGGFVGWHNANRITWTQVTGAWEYCIYGRTGGSLTWIGCSRPSGSVITDLTFDDFGSPMMDSFTRPARIPNTPPVSAVNQDLVATICPNGGAGTTTLQLCTAGTSTPLNAVTSVAGATIRLDNTPNILSAISAVQSVGEGLIHFPASSGISNPGYVVNSYLSISNANLSISLSDRLIPNDTIEIGTGIQFFGAIFPQPYPTVSFAQGGGVGIQTNEGNPGIYIRDAGGGDVFRNIDFKTLATNGALLVLGDRTTPTTFVFCNFISATSSNGYMDVGLMFRGNVGMNGNPSFVNELNDVTMLGGGSQSVGGLPDGSGNARTMTPVFLCEQCGTTKLNTFMLSNRGIYFHAYISGGSNLEISNGRFQGPIMPLVTSKSDNSASHIIRNYELDSPTGPTAIYFEAGAAKAEVLLNGAFSPAIQVSGNPLGSITLLNQPFSLTGQNHDFTNLNFSAAVAQDTNASAVNHGLTEFYGFVHFPFHSLGTPRWYFDIQRMAPPVATVAGGGAIPVGTYTYKIAAVGWDGGTGPTSAPSNGCVVTIGNQTCNLTWSTVAGAKGYNIYRLILNAGNTWVTLPSNVSPMFSGSTTSYSDTSATPTGGSIPQVSSGGTTYGSSLEVGAPQYRYTSGTSGFSTLTVATNPTANRTETWPDATGTVVLAGSSGSITANGNCSSSAAPAVCGSASAGNVVIAAGATTVTVNTTAVTANSQIFVMEDDSLGTKLSVTCNTTILGSPPEVTGRTAGTSFVITTTAAPAANPACYSYLIVN